MEGNMQCYIGTKIINAKPMTRLDYNTFRGWKLPDDENGDDDGYLVEYVGPGQKPNTPEYEGYVSWSPKDVFEKAYRPTSAMTFGQAIEMLKLGKKVARKGWNGKGMWIVLIHPVHNCVPEHPHWDCPDMCRENTHALLPFIGLKSADSRFVPWLASQTDVLATDWEIIE